MNGSDLCDSWHKMSLLASDNTQLALRHEEGDWQYDTKQSAFYEFISHTNYSLFVALTNSLKMIFDLLHDRRLRLSLPSFVILLFLFVNMTIKKL